MKAKRILIVDDEYDIRAVAQLALKTIAGWDIATAASGKEAITLATTQQPDVILLDVMMPEMDGIETFRALQDNPHTQSIPVLLMTAKVQNSERQNFARIGAAGIIPKPFKAMKLPAQISEALGWQQ